jgi:hypothetical protein
MTTLEKLELHATEIMAKLKAGEIITKEEQNILEIHNRRFSKKAGNAGKRKVKRTGK